METFVSVLSAFKVVGASEKAIKVVLFSELYQSSGQSEGERDAFESTIKQIVNTIRELEMAKHIKRFETETL